MLSDFQSEAQKKLEEIKELREKMKEVASEAKGKEDLYKQLVSISVMPPIKELLNSRFYIRKRNLLT